MSRVDHPPAIWQFSFFFAPAQGPRSSEQLRYPLPPCPTCHPGDRYFHNVASARSAHGVRAARTPRFDTAEDLEGSVETVPSCNGRGQWIGRSHPVRRQFPDVAFRRPTCRRTGDLHCVPRVIVASVERCELGAFCWFWSWPARVAAAVMGEVIRGSKRYGSQIRSRSSRVLRSSRSARDGVGSPT